VSKRTKTLTLTLVRRQVIWNALDAEIVALMDIVKEDLSIEDRAHYQKQLRVAKQLQKITKDDGEGL
jgi:hypothetical protein